ncbi:fibronectin type III domain-containing protein, partial [Chloroflexota bacterium]
MITTINDGFENTGSPAWDDLWDENGTTTWTQDTAKPHNGTYNALIDTATAGYLTSDDMEASGADNITISFWFNTKNLEAGDIWVQTYNGTDYVNWHDLTAYPTYINNVWAFFSEVITDSQYRIHGFRLRFDSTAMASTEEVNIDDVVIATDTVPPADPTGLTATAGDEEISLDWTSNNDTDLWGYNIYRGPNSGNYTQINETPVLVSNYTDTGLYGGGTFYYVVAAVDLGNNESGNSNEDSATAVDIAPAALTGLTATPGNEEISLNWTSSIVTDLDGYNVYRGTSSGNITNLISSNVSSSNFTDTGLYGGGLYYYEVTAVDLGANESGRSNTDNATAVDSAPAAPTGLAATPGDEEISLNWDDNTETDFDGYNVYRGPSSGSITSLIASDVSSSNYTDTGLYGGGLYYYEVTAVDLGVNESARSNNANATAVDIAPVAPTGLAATPGDEEISLNWDDNAETDIDGYNVYRGPSSGNITSLIASDVSVSNYTDTGLYGGGLYYYEVTAVDLGVNESTRSNTTNATAVDVAPAAPTNLAATAGPGDLEISLNWDDNTETDIDGYNVYRGPSSGNITELISSNVSVSTYTDTGLTNGVTYYYEVTAVDLGLNESARSNTDNATADNVAPAAPTNLVATAGFKQVTLDWNDNGESDLDSYNVYRGPSSGNITELISSNVSVSAYTDTGLTNGVTYYYEVTAVDSGSNESARSNTDSATPFATPATLLDDGFEGATWDANWDDNGTTDWQTGTGNNGTYSALHVSGDTFLTSDNLLVSTETENIAVSFWFNLKLLNKGPVYIQTYNGTAYNNWFELTAYPGVVKNTW